MPELPEVERARTVIADHALGRMIVAVDDTDTWVCRPHGPGEIAVALVGRTIEQAHRRGKSMWCELSGEGPVLGLHLGMSGRIIVDGVSGGDPQPRSRGPADSPWTRFSIRFADGGELALFDKRRLGRVVLDPAIDRLGPDALDITRAEFRSRIGSSNAPLKARLLDQHAIAGVGNLLADQTLWLARQAPARPASELTVEELDELRRVLRRATRAAMQHGGVHTGSFIRHRKPDRHCPRCHAPLARDTVGGRTTWYCTAEQAWPR
ncbi:MAG: formamidopyrimidine-DNA glycosylase [Thermoleophilia bacterium]|nr:formamidopyrimidine-DNA glycosylase [Thermoleophilia bacterium]